MTLQQLKYVIAIADSSSMNEAAKSLFLSQPSLSKSIRDLEEEIGITIFFRNNKGITISPEGLIFLGYARQVVDQTTLLEEQYLNGKKQRIRFRISTQHYSFAVNAFVDLIKVFGMDEYEFTLRETRTNEIIDDVKTMTSELGILYLNEFNEKVLNKLLRESDLEFTELYQAKPHVFLSRNNPLSEKKRITLSDLEPFPFLSFEQGSSNSFYFSEEISSTLPRKREIKVTDRATLFNLLIGLNGYTISSGIISEELNGKDILAIPLDLDDKMRIGYITKKNSIRSKLAEHYIENLKNYLL